MRPGGIYTTAVFCLGILYTESCNVELILTAQSSNITSPGYPYQNYPSNLRCWWKVIAANSDNNVVAEVVDSVIESSSSCTYDSLVFYDGLSDFSPRIAVICGSQKGTYISTGNSMYIKFTTDSSDENKGFFLRLSELSKCGGDLTATPTSAMLVSPGYPNKYFNNMRCTWMITAKNKYDTVVLDVSFSDIERQNNCIYDSVTVYDGNVTSVGESFGKFCGYDKPSFQSSKNQLRIVFVTDNSIVKGGFRMSYKSVQADNCNRTVTATANFLYFASPGYPEQVYRDLQCVWTIVSSQKILLQTTANDIEASDDCAHDSVTVYSGLMSSELGSFCGNSTPYYTTNTSYMTVVFKTGDNALGKGFRIGYKSYSIPVTTPTPSPTNCGSNDRTAVSTPQYLQSPGYPLAYGNNEQCFWTLQAASSSMMIRIVVLDSQLENSQTCNYDFVKVYDGRYTSSRLLQPWCGTMEPTVQSSQQSMLLFFKTDGSNIFKGFRLKYFETSEQLSCGSSLLASASATALTSPGYPGYYMNNLNCVWTVRTIYDNIKVDVIFSDIESSSDCSYDYVQVNDGSSTSYPMLGKFCGTETPTYYSSGQYITITFHSDDSNNYRGFRLDYAGGTFQTLTTASSPTNGVLHNCGTNSRTALSSMQYLLSPGYPAAYGNHVQCLWTIQAASSTMMVRIVVIESQLESSDTCNYDYVKAYDGRYTSSRLLQIWCGTMKPTVQSSQQFMLLKFKTDGSNIFKGFKLKYFETSEAYRCGGRLTADSVSATLTSPGYPVRDYENNLNCVWTISTIAYNNIKIKVINSRIESSSDCSFDYVQVNDGGSTSSPMLGKFCGMDTPTYYSSGQDVTIAFHSDNSDTDRGFSLQYTGGTFSACSEKDLVAHITFSDDFTSPNYPNNYPRNADCTWRIDTGDSDHIVSISVLSSEIEFSTDCVSDYLEAFDGFDDSSSSLGSWCGSDVPDKQSSGRYMFIKFHSDYSDTDTGFKISYMAKLKNNFSVAAVAGGTIGGIVFIVVVFVIIAAAKRSSSPVVTRVHESRGGPVNISTVSQGRFEMTATPAAFQPPPAYHEVVGTTGTVGPPPPYAQPPTVNPTVNQHQNLVYGMSK